MFPVIDKKATGVNLRRIMDERGISVREVQEYLGLASVQSIYKWLCGQCMPTIDNMYALSELFQMPIDEMICGNRTQLVRKTGTVQNNRIYTYKKRIDELLVA